MVDPNFSGINPDNLMRSIKTLEGGSKSLHSARTAYLARFHKFGLETQPLSEIGKIANWVDDELPMLRRRQALASAMELDQKGLKQGAAMVRLPEPVPTVGEAREGGKKLSEQMNKVADLSKSEAGTEFHRIAQELSKHKGDPDFTSAFYAKMDPEFLKALPLAIAASDAPTAEDDMKVFGSAFTAAVYAHSPAPGFEKAAALFHGEISKDQPTGVFTRALMQGDDPTLRDLAWWHLKLAVQKLGEPADTWSDTVGLVAAVFGTQAKFASHFWERSQKFSDDASRLYQQRIGAMNAKDRRALKKATKQAAQASRRSAREAERILGKFGMGSFSRLMEASVADGGSWLIGKVPGLRPPSSTSLFGRSLHAGGKLPLVGTVLTIGAIGWDVAHNEEKDVAIVANVGGMAAGTTGTFAGMGLVALASGPVGWGIAAGLALGFSAGYGFSYFAKTKKGRKAINAVSGAVKDVGDSFGDAASSVKKSVGGWFS
ncbi:hypothetical protein ACFQ9U_22605 [Streptomyces sp. NPDC056568]|uniref:hypothetical protein n=1 Tax=Streptomyces sp. NPDC056568 TaxID=3345866 RepID=UPI0036739F2E